MFNVLFWKTFQHVLFFYCNNLVNNQSITNLVAA